MQNYASVTELLQAFENLPTDEKSILKSLAARRLFRTQYSEPDDLIHEALHRCLNGGRRWPKNIHLVVFLSNVMKSIASTERAWIGARNSVGLDSWQDYDPYVEMGMTHPSAEEQYIELEKISEVEKRWHRLVDALTDDQDAQAVFQCQLDGLRASAIMKQHGLRPDVYEIARRRLQRKMAAAKRSKHQV